MKKILDRVIVSSDSSPRFLNFWPIVSKSWERHFEITPTLVLVTKVPFHKKLLANLEVFGVVEILQELDELPIENQAKMARWFYACKSQKQIVTIEDIDTIFLENKYLQDKLKKFNSDSLLGIGSDIESYNEGNSGMKKFPASNITGSGELFAELFSYQQGMTFAEFLQNFKGTRVFDSLEDPFNPPQYFSDESLIRALRKTQGFSRIEVIPREIEVERDWIDRSNWPIASERSTQGFVCVNFPRPLYENRERCNFILESYFPKGYPWVFESDIGISERFKWFFRHHKQSPMYWRYLKVKRVLLSFFKRISY